MLAATLLWALGLQRALASQAVLGGESTADLGNAATLTSNPANNANRIFWQVAGMLDNYWQVHAIAGRGVYPATILAGTNLYHANAPGAMPRGTEWAGLEAEHAETFATVRWEGRNGTVWTLRARRPLLALVFDGQSSSKNTLGSRDMQQTLIEGKPCDRPGHYLCPDTPLGEDLCRFAMDNGFDGILRQETAFEYIFCNASDSGAYEVAAVHRAAANYGPPRPPGTPRPRNRLPDDPYTKNIFSNLYRAAMSGHERRIVPHPEHLVSLYDEHAYPSLAEINRQPLSKHRMTGITTADVATYRAEVIQSMADRRTGASSKIDWRSVTQTVVDRYAMRLAELRAIWSNETAIEEAPLQVVHRSVLALHSMIFPYIDAPIVLETWPSPSPSSAVLASLERSKSLCGSTFTARTNDGLNKQETRVKAAIDGVVRRTCSDVIDLFGDALLVERHGHISPGTFDRWRTKLAELRKWLGWWPIWTRCERQCAWDEVCFEKSYPFALREDNTTYKVFPPPACAKLTDIVFYFGSDRQRPGGNL